MVTLFVVLPIISNMLLPIQVTLVSSLASATTSPLLHPYESGAGLLTVQKSGNLSPVSWCSR